MASGTPTVSGNGQLSQRMNCSDTNNSTCCRHWRGSQRTHTMTTPSMVMNTESSSSSCRVAQLCLHENNEGPDHKQKMMLAEKKMVLVI